MQKQLQRKYAKSASRAAGRIVPGHTMPTKPNVATIYRSVPPFLRQMREGAGLTQRELAAKLGRGQWWVARAETGSRRVDVAEFVEFCLACGAGPEDALRELRRRGGR
jgi:hypothetical protein